MRLVGPAPRGPTRGDRSMSEEKRPLPEEELPETSVLSDEQLSEKARRNREILRKTATIERAILLALTAAFMIAIIVMAVHLL